MQNELANFLVRGEPLQRDLVELGSCYTRATVTMDVLMLEPKEQQDSLKTHATENGHAMILRKVVAYQEMFKTPVMLGILVTAQLRVNPNSLEVLQRHAMLSKHANF